MRNLLAVACLLVGGLAACGDDDSGTSSDSGSADSAAPDARPADAALTSDGGACPNVVGTYSMVMTVGAGCGDLNTAAPQCIQGLNVCSIHFVSSPAGATGAVNGGATLMSDGSFTGASLIFGTVQRSGCVGSWDAGQNKLTATCGGVGSSQSCTVTMVRSSATCP